MGRCFLKGIRKLAALSALSLPGTLAVLATSAFLPSAHAASTLKTSLEADFESASRLHDVPSPLLRAIAFVESRWNHLQPEDPHAGSDHRVGGHQRAYGVMGLRDDSWFGHSLARAARLIQRTPDELKANPSLNVQGAAALLRSIADRQGISSDAGSKPQAQRLLAWQEVVRQYSGIPDDGDASTYVSEVYRVLADGYAKNGIFVPSIAFPKDQLPQDLSGILSGASDGETSQDYPAATWDASPNYSDREGGKPLFVVVHTTQGSFAGAVSWLKNPRAEVSSHYIIRSVDGFVKQLVRDKHKAWHARCWNRYSIGIEHEGWVHTDDYYTDALYESSARLSAHLARRHGIPADLIHVVGHDFGDSPDFPGSIPDSIGDCNDHSDPGRFWNWLRYLDRVGEILSF